MLQGIDHLVIVVPDLDVAIASYDQLGFTVVPGGRHAVGTHNALIAFVDGAYIELIAFREPTPGHRWWEPLQRGGGLVDFCMQTSDLAADAAAFRRQAVVMDDPQPMTRTRPDGYELRWVLAVPREGQRGVVPFLIQDETPRGERVPRETTHPNRVTGIGTVTVATDDIASVRRWYGGVLGQGGQEIGRADLEADGARFRVGSQILDFVAPRGSRGPVAEWLRSRGASPFAATLQAPAGKRGPLDETLTLGVRLGLV